MSFKLQKIGENKKGLLGGFIGMFAATIAIVIILLVFVLVSGVVKIASNNKEGVAIRSISQSGISNIYSYMNNFVKLVDIRADLARDSKLSTAIQEAEYEE